MKFHAHVGVIETADEATLDQVLAAARCTERILARPAPNLVILEREDAALVLERLRKQGLHPKVLR